MHLNKLAFSGHTPMSGVTVCLAHKGCCALFQGSKALPPAGFIFPQVSANVQESFLFHSSLLVAQVPSRLPPSFSFVLFSYVEVFLPFWRFLPYQHLISVLWKLFHSYICCICGRMWAPCSTPQPSATYINSKCTHSSVYVALTTLKRLNDSSLPSFPAKLSV